MLKRAIDRLCSSAAKVLAVTSASMLLVAAPVAASEKVTLATVAWIGYAPFYVATDKDLFGKYGVTVELKDFADPALIPSALQSGGLEGAMYTYDQVITLVANGYKFRVVMPIDYSNGADAVIASKSIKTLADLKGKKVAYPFSTCDNLLVVHALKSAGLTESDVEGIDTTPENVPAALAAGAAAGATYEPNVSKSLKLDIGEGFHLLYTSATAPGLITDVLYFSEDYIAKKPKVIDSIIKGYLDGMKFMAEHPDEANAIIGKYLASTVDEVKEQSKGVHNIPVADMAGFFVPRDDAQSLFTSGKGIAEILVKRAQIKAAPKIEDTFNASFVKALTAAR